MAFFNRNSIAGTEYEWFKNKLDLKFTIDDTPVSKVIFGFNGIGKTTLYKCIKNLNNSSIDFLDYGEMKNILPKQKSSLVISTNINLIEQINSQIDTLKISVDLKKSIDTNFGIKNVSKAKTFGTRIQSIQKDGTFNGFTKTQADIIAIETLVRGVSPKVFIDIQSDLALVVNAQQELQKENNHLLFHALKNIDEVLDYNDNTCPVCDNSAVNIKQIVQSKMSALDNIQSNLIIKLKESNYHVDSNQINDLVHAHQIIANDEDIKADYLICGGTSSNYSTIQQVYSQITSLQSQLTPLMLQAQQSYLNIQNSLGLLIRDLSKYFGVNPTNVISNHTNYSITIKFPRDISTYSTGELNLISFLYKMYSFIGSDKSIMVLDDPVSSLDLVNHYKIAYEIVKNASKTKTLVILTHSVELINVINSQFLGRFEFYYLEENQNLISIQQISPNYNITSSPNLIILERLPELQPFIGFIDAVKRREIDNADIAIQQLFHYTLSPQYLDNDVSKFSNYDLIRLIDNFNGFTYSDFYSNSMTKVIYLAALRLWVEKKLYETIPSSDLNLQTRYISAYTLNDRINIILPFNGVSPVSLPTGLSRDVLVSKKVMLNQSVHYYSQIMPFAYAINLSLDMLKDEIDQLKQLFS